MQPTPTTIELKPLHFYQARQAFILCDFILPTFLNLKLCIVDVGADLFNQQPFWQFFPLDRLVIHAFDFEPSYCGYLKNIPKEMSLTFHEFAVSDSADPLTVNLYSNTAASSRFEFNSNYLQFVNHNERQFEPAPLKKVALRSTTLDSWQNDNSIGPVDILNMNIQGGELAAIRGAESMLDNVIAIHTEMAFSQTYLQAPLFGEVDQALRNNRFEFFDIRSMQQMGHNASQIKFPKPSFAALRHKIFEGHFLYFKDPFSHVANQSMSVEQVVKLICAAEVYGHCEYAFALLNWVIQREEAKVRVGDGGNGGGDGSSNGDKTLTDNLRAIMDNAMKVYQAVFR